MTDGQHDREEGAPERHQAGQLSVTPEWPLTPATTSTTHLPLTLETLGALRLRSRDQDLLIGRRQELVLLAYLLRQAPRPVTRRTLLALLWGDRDEQRARHSLRQTLLRLKREAGAAIHVDAESVTVVPEAVRFDVDVFERALEAHQLAEAVACWRGEFLPGADDLGCDVFRTWLESEREGLRSRVSWALEQLTATAERNADWTTGIAWAEQWAAVRPLDERPHVRLVQLLQLSGRLDEALARHAAFLVRRRDEIDQPPSPNLEQLTTGLHQAASPRVPGDDASPSSSWLLTPAVVGRAEALGTLVHAWQRVQEGAHEAVIVVADDGLGKTRLCQEFIRWLAVRGDPALCMSARGLSSGAAAVPWATAGELLEPLLEAPGLFGASPQALAELTCLLPPLHQRVRQLPTPQGTEHALVDAVAEVLREVSAEVPVVVFVDDLAAADEASRRLVLTLVRRRAKCRGLFLLTALPEGLHVGGALSELRDDAGVRRIRLEPLTPTEVDRFVANAVDLPVDERGQLCARLVPESGGNPLFLTEMLAALAEEGRLVPSAAGQWHLSSTWSARPLPEPASIRTVIERRLACLNASTRRLVEAAAVYGEPFDVETAEALTGLARPALFAALNDLIARRLARESSSSATHFELAHDLIRRVAYASIPPEWRRELHRTVLVMLEQRGDRRSSAARVRAMHEAAIGPSTSHAPTSIVLVRLLAEARHHWSRVLPLRVGAAIALTLIVGTALVGVALGRMSNPTTRPPVLAVGRIDDFTGQPSVSPESGKVRDASAAARPSRSVARKESTSALGGATATSAPAIAAMLATDLARVAGLRVVSSSRMYELLAAGGANEVGPLSAGAVEKAARAAGASQVIEGSLYRRADGALRLDLRRVDLASGAVLSASTVEARDPFTLVDRATSDVARSAVVLLPEAALGERAPTPGIADVTTSSFEAYRLYERGLRAYYELAPGSPQELFAAAVQADPSFAMATFYLAQSKKGSSPDYYELVVRAARLAERATERERLLIRGAAAFELNEPERLALADSFVARYPGDPEGLVLRGRARIWDGDWRGLADLRRVIAMDTLPARSGSGPCLVCEARGGLIEGYWLADSLGAAERVARAWVDREPTAIVPVWTLVSVLSYAGRYDEAIAMGHQADRVHLAAHPEDSNTVAWSRPLQDAQIEIRAHRFLVADSLLWHVRRTAPEPAQSGALWLLTVSLRAQGRLEEAARVASTMAELWRRTSNAPDQLPLDPLLARAQVLFEMGRPSAAATLFESLTRVARAEPFLHAWSARHRVWMLTLAASAHAAAGDTVPLSRLADSVEQLGAQSAYGRDRRLHHHIRGLLLRARGAYDTAAVEFRQAIYSPTTGYTRSNLELGRTLLALHRPNDAVAALRPALHGAIDASNYYVTRTDIEEMLAEAFAAAGARDSAAVYYRYVLDAWRRAEPAFQARITHARRQLATMRSSR